jgi:hypothetical protein
LKIRSISFFMRNARFDPSLPPSINHLGFSFAERQDFSDFWASRLFE